MSLFAKKPSITEAQVLEALSTIRDPDLHKDIVSLGFVKNVAIEGGRVSFTIMLTTPACPVREHFQAEAEAAVRTIPGVTAVAVDMQATVIRSGGALEKSGNPEGVSHVLAVASGKGGVGKTTVCVNLAVALADAGAKVGILDADITGPNIPLMMGLNQMPSTRDGKIVPLINYSVKVMSIGFLVPEGQPVIWRSPMIHKAIQQFLFDVAWDELDYLIIDLPPGTGDASLTVAQSLPLTGVVVVGTPQEVALLDVRKCITMFQKLEAPILGIVENMSYYLCPHCGQRTEIFGHGGAKRDAERLGIPFLGAVPLYPSIRVSGDEGQPILRAEPASGAAQAFREVAGNLAARISTAVFEQAQTAAVFGQRGFIPLKTI